MNDRLKLHVPAFEELWYREKLLGDPETMSYNAGYHLALDTYHNDTGCIDFPREAWQAWYGRFIGREPERFYAYLMRREDGVFIGEVNLHTVAADTARYEMGIVIEARYRGLGYSEEGLRLLLNYAFTHLHAESVCNSFEIERTAAIRAHLAAGFELKSTSDGAAYLEIGAKAFG